MARRSDHSREELHALILSAAREIVAEAGPRALTARGIATRIGYSAGTLYNLFDDLDDLILHLNAITLDALHDALSAAAVGGDPEKDMKALSRAYLRFSRDNRHLWALLFEHRLPEGRPLPDWYRDKIARLLGLVEAVLDPCFAPDRAATKARAVRVLWCGVHGICALAEAGKLDVVTSEAVTSLIDDLIATYLAGIDAAASAVSTSAATAR